MVEADFAQKRASVLRTYDPRRSHTEITARWYRQSAEFRDLLRERYTAFGQKLSPATMRALIVFAENFYKQVYPPEREKDDQAFDFGAAKFLHDYVRSSRGLAQSSSWFEWGAMISSAWHINGTGSQPVSAMRPANTET